MLSIPAITEIVRAAPMPLFVKEQILDQVLGHHDDLRPTDELPGRKPLRPAPTPLAVRVAQAGRDGDWVHPVIARMDEVQQSGHCDQARDGFPQLYRVNVANECLLAQAIAEGDELVIGFFSASGELKRRLLVTADAEFWLDVDGKAVKHFGKYAAAAAVILRHRATANDKNFAIARAA